MRIPWPIISSGLGKGGDGTLSVGGAKAGQGKIDATPAMIFSADDGGDNSRDTGAPVWQDYGPLDDAFNGTIRGVQPAIADALEAADHEVVPEAARAWAMARQ